MTAANNMDIWHRGVEKGAVALENAWRRVDLRQSNLPRHREASGIRAAGRTFVN